MSYRTTKRADQDIIDIYVRGSEEFGQTQAEHYYDGLVAMFDVIAANPRLARERREFEPPVRLHPHRSHMIVYGLNDTGVLIVRVLHGRQDWEQRL